MPAFIEADFTFHRTVVNATHNPLLVDLYDDIAQAVYESIAHTAYGDPGADGEMDRKGIDHNGLAEAVHAGDPDRALREAACYLDELLSLATD